MNSNTIKLPLRANLLSCPLMGCLILGSLSLPAPNLEAQVNWSALTGNFTDGANWSSLAFPSTIDTACIQNGGTATLNADAPNTISQLWIGNGSGATGALIHTSGTLGITSWLMVGRSNGGTTIGSYYFTGGTLNKSGVDPTCIGDNNGCVGTMTIAGNASFNSTGAGEFRVGNGTGRGTLNIDGGIFVMSGANIAVAQDAGSIGIVNQTGGIVSNLNQQIIISRAAGAHGEWNMSGGTNTVNNWTAVGTGGNDGLLNISGGLWSNAAANVTLGSFAGNKGKTLVSGSGTLYSLNDIWVGENGAGTLIVSNGAVYSTGISVGRGTTGNGTLAITNGLVSCKTLNVGYSLNSAGAVVQSGGTFTSLAGGGDWHLGGNGTGDANSYGAFTLSSGLLTSAFNLQIGAYGKGSYEQTGGTFSNSAWPVIGRFGGSVGVATISGGTFNQAGVNRLIIGEQGTGTLTVAGSALIDLAANLRIAMNYGGSPGNGTVNLNGGTLSMPAVEINGGTSTLNFNGGRLAAKNDSTNFLQGLSTALVYPGGGTIDTAGRNITVAQPLLAPQNCGIADIAINNAGSGYIGPPLVLISGGSGTGATAIARLTTSGTVTNIQITCPGTGYQTNDVLTVVLSGGGYTAAATTGTVSYAANGPGGLTKDGAGTLTLTASNTYSGLTIISNGTLKIASSSSIYSSSGINVSSGGVFDATAIGGWTVLSNCSVGGSGLVNTDVTVNAGGIMTPGNSSTQPGTLTVQGNLTVDNGAIYNWHDNGSTLTGDLINVTGTLTLPTTGTLNLTHTTYATRNSGQLFQCTSLSAPDVKGWKLTVDGVPYPNGVSLYATGGNVFWLINRGTLLIVR